ncbi:MAG: HAD family phosphatase [Propioniciclava sp.]|uniref:HAD family hydrolase n=1 Tax=Propioniciclava sp. TaxID=2038686 RepID=UPI0039E63AA7
MPAELTIGVDLPSALLWDFDGTLVETEHHWHTAESRLLAEWGLDLAPEQKRQLTGLNLSTAIATMMSWAGVTDADPADAGRRLTSYMLDELRSHSIIFRPGARTLLESAFEAGIPCALVSASHEDILATVVDLLPAGMFATIVAGNHITHGKPHPEPYLTAASRLGYAPRDCLALEDSRPGLESASGAGVPTVGIPFEQELDGGPLRRLLPTLRDVGLIELGVVWRELRDA